MEIFGAPLLAKQFLQSPPFGCLKIFGALPQYLHPPPCYIEWTFPKAEKKFSNFSQLFYLPQGKQLNISRELLVVFPLTRGTLQFKGIHISRKKNIFLISPNFLALSITVLSRKPLCLIMCLASALSYHTKKLFQGGWHAHMQELRDIQYFMDKTTIYHLSMCFKTVTVSNIQGVQ